MPLTASSPIEPPGKRSRLDDVGVGRERELDVVDRDRRGVGELVQRVGRERRRKQSLDQALRGLAAGPVGHVDPLIAELRALAARRLDDPQDLLLALGDDGRIGHQTTWRSRAKRPKL